MCPFDIDCCKKLTIYYHDFGTYNLFVMSLFVIKFCKHENSCVRVTSFWWLCILQKISTLQKWQPYDIYKETTQKLPFFNILSNMLVKCRVECCAVQIVQEGDICLYAVAIETVSIHNILLGHGWIA